MLFEETFIIKEIVRKCKETGVVPNVVSISGWNYRVDDILSEAALQTVRSIVAIRA